MNEKIHFDDFAEQVALEVGVDVDTAKDYIYTMFETIIEENEKGEWVKIRNFGSFHPVHNKERRTRNPQTGNMMTVPAHYHVNFKSSETLSKIVNVKYGHLHPQVIEEERKNAMPLVIGGGLVMIGLIIALFLIFSGGEEKRQPVQAPVIQQDEADRGQAVEEETPAVEELPSAPMGETYTQTEPAMAETPAPETPPVMEEAVPAEREAYGDDVVEDEEPETYAETAEQEAPAETDMTPETEIAAEAEARPEADMLPETETESSDAERVPAPRVGEVGIVYTVHQKDTLTEISEDAYENSDFWPLIFSRNYLVVRDPDLIRPKTELAIPGRPDLTEQTDMDRMYGGYIQAYQRYKGLGKDQKAIWLLFRGYVKVDKGIIERPEVSEADRVEVLDYIRRYDP